MNALISLKPSRSETKSPLVRDLLLCAKHLFVVTITVWHGQRLFDCRGYRMIVASWGGASSRSTAIGQTIRPARWHWPTFCKARRKSEPTKVKKKDSLSTRKRITMKVQVELCAGPLGLEMPMCFRFGRREVEIVKTVNRWHGPNYCYFKGKWNRVARSGS